MGRSGYWVIRWGPTSSLSYKQSEGAPSFSNHVAIMMDGLLSATCPPPMYACARLSVPLQVQRRMLLRRYPQNDKFYRYGPHLSVIQPCERVGFSARQAATYDRHCRFCWDYVIVPWLRYWIIGSSLFVFSPFIEVLEITFLYQKYYLRLLHQIYNCFLFL